jgi:hypothetical protein
MATHATCSIGNRPSTTVPNIFSSDIQIFSNHSTTVAIQSITMYDHTEMADSLSYFSIPTWHCLGGLRKFTNSHDS